MKPPLRTDPEFLTYYASVLTREAEARPGTEFGAWLLECAGRAMQRAIAGQAPVQPDLFHERTAV